MQFLEENIAKRESNYLLLEKIILENDDLIHLNHEHIARLSTFAIPVVCKSRDLRNEYFNRFSGAGIEIRPMIAGNIQLQPFYIKYVKVMTALPNTDFLHNNGFYCGNYPELSQNDIETISSCFYKF